MHQYLHSLFETFAHAAAEARETGDKYRLIDRVYQQLDELALFPLPEVLGCILALIERFPELDYGGPGPFGTYIEEHRLSEYTPALLASIHRQPSIQTLGWLDRTMGVENFQNGLGTNPVSPAQFAQALEQVIAGTQATPACREFAESCLSDLKKNGLIDA
ncbi:MAG: hypothetical protein ABWY06_15920 [Pseudomonas sp.]|uniref:hypothetical protein n=1 Tax=Pseudomonas sp. TaxID=306 RepID=UPI003395CC20